MLIINSVSETQFKLSFLTPFTCGKKYLEKPLQYVKFTQSQQKRH